MKQTIVLSLALVASICTFAQVQILPNGHLVVGTESVDRNQVSPSNLDTVPMLAIYGPFGDMGQGGRISFGDNASIWNHNILIGELGEEDNDILWLHGKHGLYYTHGSYCRDTIFCYDDTKGNFFKFNCDVKASGLFIASDESFKSNITSIEGSAEKILKLKPVQYNLLPFIGKNYEGVNGGETEKEIRDAQFYDEFYKSIEKGELRYGLLAQEVEEIFPNLVSTGKDGKKYVDYIGLIPLLIDAINELSEKVEYLENENEAENIQLPQYQTLAAVNDVMSSTEYLSQNTPNPFNATSVINYRIPDGATVAQICFFDLQGKMLKSVTLSEHESSITVSNTDFVPGMYLYALIVDGKEIDVKRMVLTK